MYTWEDFLNTLGKVVVGVIVVLGTLILVIKFGKYILV